MFKKIIIILGVLLVLIVGGGVIAPSFINWNAQFPRIAAQVKQATGRDLTIGGRLEVRLLPTPTLTARDVTLSNAPGAGSAPMVKFDAVEIRMALLPLLSGQLRVERIRLINPVIRIETMADGRSNLNFSPVGEGTSPSRGTQARPSSISSSTGKQGSGLKLRFDNFKIINATLIYRNVRKNQTETIHNLDATLRAASLNGPFAAQGQGRMRGMPFTFDISLGQLIAERTLPVNAVLTGPAGIHAQISGAVLNLESNPRFKGTLNVAGDNLAAVLNAVSNAPKPVALRKSFALDGTLNVGAQALKLSNFAIQLGTMRMSAQAKVKFGKTTTFDVALKAARIDVDRLLRPPLLAEASKASSQGVGDAPRSSATIMPLPPKVEGAKAQKVFALPKNISGTVSLNVDALTVKGGLISDLKVRARLANGEFALNQFRFLAPGVSNVALFGFMRVEGGKPEFDGNLEMLSSSPKGLADWLSVKMPAGVVERLKRISFKSKIKIDPTQVALSAIRLSGDRTEVTGGVTVALRARPSFGADLNVDTLNLDTYAANPVLGVENPPLSGLQAPPRASSRKAAETPLSDIATAWTALNALNDFDANLKLHLGQLTAGGRTFKNFVFDGTLYAGTLNVRELRLGSYQGASADLSGTFNGFGGVPEMSAVKIKAKVKNAAVLGAALGIKNLPRGMRAMSLDARAEGSFLQPRISVNVGALGGVSTVRGRFSFLPIGFGFKGDVTLRNRDMVKMFAALGYVPVGPLGALDMKAKLETDGVNYDISALTGRIGKTPISGTLSLRTGGPKLQVTANLQTGSLDLAPFLPKANGRTKKRADAAPSNPLLILAAYQRDAQTLRVNKRWSRKAFDFGVLNVFNGELTLKADTLRFGAYALNNADIHAIVKDGVLTADRVVGQMFGGAVSGTAVVRAKGLPSIETNLKVETLDVGQAVQAIVRKNLATGKLSFGLSLNANGESPAALVSSLSGKGTLSIKALDVKKGGRGTALAPIIGLVAALNQFSLPMNGRKKSGLADLSSNFDILNGVANVKTLKLSSALGSGSGSGRVDIARWTIDFAGKMIVEPNILSALLSKGRVGREEVPFSVSGRLDNPGVKLGLRSMGGSPRQTRARPADAFQEILRNVVPGIVPAPARKTVPTRRAPKKLGGELAPPPPQETAPSSRQKKLSPQELIIRQLMKGL